MKKSKRKKLFSFSIGLIGLLIVVPIVSKVLYDIFEVYNLKRIPKEYFTNILSLFNLKTYKAFFAENLFNMIGWIIIGYYIFSCLFNDLLKSEEMYTQTDEYGSHGTRRWQDKKEIINNYYKDDLGWFIGSVKEEPYKLNTKGAYIPVNGNLNMQLIVVGPPGSYKTTGFVLPNIFHIPKAYKERNLLIDKKKKKREDNIKKRGKKIEILYKIHDKVFNNKLNKEMPDFIITDPKSEILSLTMEYLESMGYEVRVLDFIHLKYGDCLNPLDFIDSDKELMEIAQTYIDSVDGAIGQTKGGDNAFWGEQEGQVLAALMGYVKQKYPKEKQNLSEVTKILTSEEVKDIESAKFFFEDQKVTGASKQLWDNFLMIADSERTRANILGGLATKLKLFAIEEIQKITQKSTFDITKLGTKKEKPIAIFLLMPDGDRTFSPIINVVVSTIHKQLYRTAYKTKNRLPNPVYEILEEMANIGKISGIQEMLGTMRGRRIYPMMIWQSLSQMKDRYKDGWEDMLSMCDSKIYLGVNDDFTANYCSKSLGNTTIKIQGTSKKDDKSLLTYNARTENESYIQRKLMLPEECSSLDKEKLIVVQRANNPVILNKSQYRYWKYKICNPKDIFEIREMGEDKYNLNEINNIQDKYREVENIKDKAKDIDIEKSIDKNLNENDFKTDDFKLDDDFIKEVLFNNDNDFEMDR